MAGVPLTTRWFGLQRVWRYFWRARTAYDVHSPFLSAWIAAVLEDQRRYYIQGDMRALRAWYDHSPVKVQFSEDFGAGSRAGQGVERSAKELARWSGVDDFTGMLLFRTALHSQPQTILELGTNVGFSAAYLRAARRQAKFISIEGQEAVSRLAADSFRRLRLPAPDLRVGSFADVLPAALKDLAQVDLAFLDGDHRAAATNTYLDMIWPYLHAQSVVIIGDIHWSSDMEAAWEAARQRPGVQWSVDLYHMGLLFFSPAQQSPTHHTLIPARFKPWRMGFFHS